MLKTTLKEEKRYNLKKNNFLVLKVLGRRKESLRICFVCKKLFEAFSVFCLKFVMIYVCTYVKYERHVIMLWLIVIIIPNSTTVYHISEYKPNLNNLRNI
jgi:hypothetical protein